MPGEALLVGAGLAGSACALGLVRAGWSVRIVERAAGAAGGAGIVLHPNAMLALAELGVAEEVRAAGSPLRHLVLSDGDGDGDVRVDLHEVWGASGAGTTGIARPRLAAILGAALADRGIGAIEGEVVAARDDAERPSVELADGRVLAADVVIGCDGLRSAVRAAVDATSGPVPTGLWWARWVAGEGVAGPDDWVAHTSDGTVSGGYAIGGGQTHVFLQVPEAEAGDADALIARAATQSPVLASALESGARLVHAGPGATVHPHCWSGRRIALAGDAAHALSPTMSEGGGLALEDGVVLGHALAAAPTAEEGLARYATRRRARVAWAARMGALQLGAASRPRRPRAVLDAASATRYLRAIYEPLMAAA